MFFRDWLAGGKHGSMRYLEEDVETRVDPAAILRPPHGPTGVEAKSALVVADLYATRNDGPDVQEHGRGRVARYARGRDYHKVIKKRLHSVADRLRAVFPGEEFRTFVDSAPVMERELAQRAGLGWIGKHTLAIHPRLGSWFLLGGFVTTMELEAPPEQAVVTDHCGTCTRCIDACPTGCIEPYSVDASRCISYLTIESEGAFPEDLEGRTGDWLLGCDVCQEVCPHNSPRDGDVGRVGAQYERIRDGFGLLEVLGWDEGARREAFTRSPMKRVKLDQIKRNVLAVAGSRLADDASLLSRVRAIAGDESESELVRAAARAALRRAGMT